MARYKNYSYDQGKLIAVTFAEQLHPGTYEYALHHIIEDEELDVSIFEERFTNTETGAPAYDQRILLKIILFAYSRGILGSRKIAQVCCENVTFMALSADSRPHFTTIASFISTMHKEIVSMFRNVLLICSEQGLIGKHMFAIDGCKISSNCSKEWSGTKEDFKRKKKKLERSINYLVKNTLI
jgi:transposase